MYFIIIDLADALLTVIAALLASLIPLIGSH